MTDIEEIALEELSKKELAGGLEYTDILAKPTPTQLTTPLGFATFVEEKKESAMESPWKILPIDNLPSEGFGYPTGAEILIRAAEVNEIKHFSTIDEGDPLSIDEKINYIVSKFTIFRCSEGTLSPLDLHQEDRFYIFMSIRDFSFIKGENKIFIPIKKVCKEATCNLPNEIELKSNLLSSFKLNPELKKFYDKDRGCFDLLPNNGDPSIQLFIPTIGVSTEIRKILKNKKERNKTFDEFFANVSPYIIPNWRGLTEDLYDKYEFISKSWTYTQFAIADDISKQITFATKDSITVICNKCGAEVTAPIRFHGGIRSLFVVSDVIGKFLGHKG